MPFEPVPPPPDMERIDRRELYTSLPARMQFLLSFLEFTHDDVAALVDGQKYIKSAIPGVVDLVYKKLLKYDITARVFTTRDSRNEDPVDRWATQDSVQIQNRKMFLRWYLIKLNSDPTKMEYWEYLDKVGMMHTGRIRRDPLHVDYVFLGALLGFIQEAMFEAILTHKQLDITKKIAVVKALGKVIWIQNDLLERWHNADGAEYTDDTTGKQTTSDEDPEGYLNGRKILGEGIDDGQSMRSRSTSSTGKTSLGRPIEEAEHISGGIGCPFSRMVMHPPEVLEDQRATSPRISRRPSTGDGAISKQLDQLSPPARRRPLNGTTSRDGKTVRIPSDAFK